jgi:hypothetical protein
MTERVMSINAIPSYLITALQANIVKVREVDRVVTIEPLEALTTEKKYRCPFLGIATDSNVTVDKFFEWKRGEREAEVEQ